MDGVLLFSLALIGLGILVWYAAHRQKQRLGMPSGPVVYHDTAEHPGNLLMSPRHQLKGKPDFLIRQAGEIIPVEAKTGSTPTSPYHGHIMQLIAYCILVETHYGSRPPYGIIRYPKRQFTIDYTPAREQELLSILAEMRQHRHAVEVHRSHTHPKRCAACGYQHQCNESLAQQTGL